MLPMPAMPLGAVISQEPGASFAHGGSPWEQRKPGPSPALEVREASHLLLLSLVYLLTSRSWTRCCVIGNPRVLSRSEMTSAIFVCVAAGFSARVDAFLVSECVQRCLSSVLSEKRVPWQRAAEGAWCIYHALTTEGLVMEKSSSVDQMLSLLWITIYVLRSGGYC